MRQKLGDYVQQIRGVSYKPGDLSENATNGYIPLLRANNIHNGELVYDNLQYVHISKIRTEQILQKGDILLCASSGSLSLVGKAALYGGEGEYTFGAFCKVIRVKTGIAPEYLACYFSAPKYRRYINNIALGVNINNIRNEHIDNLTIKVPSVKRQLEIVRKLSLVKKIINCRKRQLSKLDNLVKARFVEMFEGKGHPHHTLSSLIQEGASISYGIVQPGDDGTGDVGIVRPVDLCNGKVFIDSIKYIDKKISNAYKKTELSGDELIITVRGTTGLTALTNHRCAGMNVTRGIAVIRYDKCKINPVYLNSYFNTDDAQHYIQEHTKGATLRQINLSDLRIQQVLVPPLEEQDSFAAFVEQVDKSKVAVQKALDKAQQLYDSLMQEYFD